MKFFESRCLYSCWGDLHMYFIWQGREGGISEWVRESDWAQSRMTLMLNVTVAEVISRAIIQTSFSKSQRFKNKNLTFSHLIKIHFSSWSSWIARYHASQIRKFWKYSLENPYPRFFLSKIHFLYISINSKIFCLIRFVFKYALSVCFNNFYSEVRWGEVRSTISRSRLVGD